MAKTFLSQLNWRFATKKFDRKKKVSPENLQKVLDAVKFTPTSHGLQIYHVYVVTDQKIKDELTQEAYGQSQVSDCSHLLVICYRTDADKRVDEYVDLVGEVHNSDQETLSKMRNRLHDSMQSKMPDELINYVAKQAYIVLGFAMAACAELEIDSCPMEGFKPPAVDKVLNLPENMNSVLLLPIGYRAEDPKRSKVRFPKEDLFTFIE